MRRDREARGDQEAAEVQRVPRVRVRAGRREPVVLDDVARRPGADSTPTSAIAAPTPSVSGVGRAKSRYSAAEHEAERQAQLLVDKLEQLNPPAPGAGGAR